MAFIQETPNKLTLTFRPWYMWVTAGICCLVWLPMFSLFAPKITTTSLICQRPKPQSETCQLVETNLLLFNTKTIPIQELQGARVDKQNISDSSGQFQRLILITKQGEIPFYSVKTFRPSITSNEFNNIASQINHFIKTPQESFLKIERDDIIIVNFFIGLIAINLIWFAFCSDVVICVFDKGRGYLIKKRQWFYIITRTVEYQLHDIIDIQVQEKQHRSVKGYRITLLLASGKNVHLTSYQTNFFKGRRKMDETADAIAKFLGRHKIFY